MKKFLALCLSLTTMLSLTACGGNSTAQSGSNTETERTEPLVIRFGATGGGNEDDVQWLANREIIARVEEETNGMIQFEYYPSQQLGSATSMLDQVLMGALDMTVVQPNVAAAVWPEFNLLVLPFAFPDMETYWDCMLDGDMYDLYSDIAKDKAIYLGTCSASYRGLQNNVHPIRCADDFKGLTFRVQAGDIFVDTFKALGASTSLVQAGELYAALQQGMVDGEEGPISWSYEQGIWELAKYTTELNCTCSNAQLFMSLSTWNKLTEKEKDIITRACHEEPKPTQLKANERVDEFYQLYADAGIEVTRWADLTEDERSSFHAATAPLWEKYKAQMDSDFYEKWEANMKAGWEKNGYDWQF